VLLAALAEGLLGLWHVHLHIRATTAAHK
jgi:hypothetical protein